MYCSFYVRERDRARQLCDNLIVIFHNAITQVNKADRCHSSGQRVSVISPGNHTLRVITLEKQAETSMLPDNTILSFYV